MALPTFQAVHKPHTPATPPNVLIIWDNSSSNSNTLSLKSALEDEGFSVSLISTKESSINGTNPALSSYESVIHLK